MRERPEDIKQYIRITNVSSFYILFNRELYSMIKTTSFIALFLMASVSSVHAATYKGQKIYMDTGKECHGGGKELAESKNIRTWEKFMDKKGEKLSDIHLASKKAQASHEYF